MGNHDPSSFLRCLPFNCKNVFDIQLVMGKESSGTSPDGRGSVKWPEMQEIINTSKCDCQVERRNYSPCL